MLSGEYLFTNRNNKCICPVCQFHKMISPQCQQMFMQIKTFLEQLDSKVADILVSSVVKEQRLKPMLKLGTEHHYI